MGDEGQLTYRARTGRQYLTVGFLGFGAVVFFSVIVTRDWWGFGTAASRNARRIAPILLLIAVALLAHFVGEARRGPIRVDRSQIYNPFARRNARRIPWREVTDVRRQPGGSSVEIITKTGLRSVIPLSVLREPERVELELLDLWRRVQSGL